MNASVGGKKKFWFSITPPTGGSHSASVFLRDDAERLTSQCQASLGSHRTDAMQSPTGRFCGGTTSDSLIIPSWCSVGLWTREDLFLTRVLRLCKLRILMSHVLASVYFFVLRNRVHQTTKQSSMMSIFFKARNCRNSDNQLDEHGTITAFECCWIVSS